MYGGNNPVVYVDVSGELAYPGQIHNLVVNYISNKYGYQAEQTILYKFGWGRADLISANGEVWDVKRDKPSQIGSGVTQVLKYTQNTWKRFPDIELKIGGYISSGEFIKTINVDTYYITYRYAGSGVIAYDYYKVTDWNKVMSYAMNAGISVLSALLTLVSQGVIELQPVF